MRGIVLGVESDQAIVRLATAAEAERLARQQVDVSVMPSAGLWVPVVNDIDQEVYVRTREGLRRIGYLTQVKVDTSFSGLTRVRFYGEGRL